MMRYVRAFIKALKMTAQGETITPTPPPPQIPEYYVPLQMWINEGMQKLASVVIAADKAGLSEEKRASMILTIDGHKTSFDSTLKMVRHNLTTEYPKLMQLDDAYTMMVVQSSNMNDQYRISRFMGSEDITDPDVKTALEVLNEHLMNLPAIEYPGEEIAT